METEGRELDERPPMLGVVRLGVVRVVRDEREEGE